MNRLKAMWLAFKFPVEGEREKELERLVREMYEWTNHKHTPWAIRAKKAIGDIL